MTDTFSYLINEKLTVKGKKIYCKVTGLPDTAKDGQKYILVISGGPGFGHELTELGMRRLIPIADKEKSPLPHFIFFDNLGCGQSDKALDPENEYTIDFFTDLSAALVEVIKEKLGLSKMRLCIDGGSFGSMVAMNFPVRKPKWLDSNSEIQLVQITSKVGPNGANMERYTLDYLKEHHSKHFNYNNMVAAQKKLFSGNIKDQADYVQNFVMPMATLYVKNIDKSVLSSTLLSLVNYCPNLITSAVDWADYAFKFIGLVADELEFFNIMIGKCSLEVLNHFFKRDFNGFNLIKLIEQHKDLYTKIPICLIAANKDHIVDYKTAQTIHEMLNNTSALFIFNEAHMLNNDSGRDIYSQLNYSLSVSHSIKDKEVSHPILQHEIPEHFKEQLSEIGSHASNVVPVLNKSPARYSLFANPNFQYAAAIGTTIAFGVTVNSLMK